MKLDELFLDQPIRGKLTLIASLSAGASLLLAALIAMAYLWIHLRAELENITHSQATIVAANSASALLLNRPQSAQQTLQALGAFGNVEFAMLLDKQDKLFAVFAPAGKQPPPLPPPPQAELHRFMSTHLDVFHPIIVQGEQVGTIHVRSSLAHMYEQMAWSLLLVLATALVGLGLTQKLVAYLHPAITGPIARLADLMNVISRDNSFDLRAETSGKDEISALAKGLNNILAQIQARDSALGQSRQRLEHEVTQRTAELKAANIQLGRELAERKAAEREIQIIYEDLSILLESLPVAIYRRLAQDGYPATYVSQNVIRFSGYPSRNFTEQDDFWMRQIHPDDAPRITGEIARLFEKGAHEYEYRWKNADGVYRWIQDSMRLVQPVDEGTPLYIVGIWQDITKRKHAEENIRKQQEFISQIIETIPMRVFWKDHDLRYLGCNTLFAKNAGLTRADELIGKTDFDLGWKDQAEMYRADDRLVMDSNTAKLSYDEPQTTPEGAQIWLRTSKVPLRNEIDETIGVLGVYEDITAYKQMELSLRESEERFRNITELTTDWVWQIDAHGAYVYSGVKVHDLLGYDPEEVVGKTPFDFMPPEEAARVAEIFENIVSDQKPFSYLENVNLHKDGHKVILETSGVPLFSGDGMFHGYFGTERDVTERKQTEEKIRKLNESLEEKVRERTQQLLEAQDELVRKEKLAVLGQVAGSVGHELRNPLGVMNNAVYFLQTVLSDADATTQEYLNIIKEEIAGSERIVSDLLDSVRTKPPHPEAVGLRELIEQTLHKYTVPPSVTVKLNIPETLPPLRVDAMQIHQVFRNLISNGVEAMPEGGALEISAVENKPDGSITVSVRDSGAGIAPEVLAKLFQPLFTTKARGIGLGLVVVKNLTEANGGKVAVASEAGKGATFFVTLPSDRSMIETA